MTALFITQAGLGFKKKKMIGMPSSVPRKDTDTLANGIISNEITHKVIKM